jgi:hypothetical protein
MISPFVIETKTRTYNNEIILSEVFESLHGFWSHDFVMYRFVVGDDDEAMTSVTCKPFHLCQKLFIRLHLLKNKILCG